MDVEYRVLSSSPMDFFHPPANLQALPYSLLFKVFSYCDGPALNAMSAASSDLAAAVNNYQDNNRLLTLDGLPSEVILCVFKFLERKDLGRVAQVCQTTYSMCTCLSRYHNCYFF